MQREKFLLLVNLISIPVGTAHLGALFFFSFFFHEDDGDGGWVSLRGGNAERKTTGVVPLLDRLLPLQLSPSELKRQLWI